jgi:hypothetical protein
VHGEPALKLGNDKPSLASASGWCLPAFSLILPAPGEARKVNAGKNEKSW